MKIRIHALAFLLLSVLLVSSFPVSALEGPSLVINEIAWRGTIASSSDEWIELYNPYDSAIDLTNWTLQYQSGPTGTPYIINLEGILDPFSYYLLERKTDDPVNDITADKVYPSAAGQVEKLNDTGNQEQMQLLDAQGNLIDEITEWYVNLTNPPGGISNRSTMEKINPFLAGTAESNWAINNNININGTDNGDNPIYGTPGQINSATGLLFGFAYNPTLPQLPDPPTMFTATQLDHRIQLNWETPPMGQTSKLLVNGVDIENISSSTIYSYRPSLSSIESYRLFYLDQFTQQSNPLEVSYQYYLPSPPTAEELLINEYKAYAPIGEDEWIELYNSTATWKDISECTLKDTANNNLGQLESTDAIGPFGYFVVTEVSGLNNSSAETITLTCNDTIIDHTFYGSGTPPTYTTFVYNENEGYIPSSNDQNTLGRTPDGSIFWTKFVEGESVTQGSANPDFRPLPGFVLDSVTHQKSFEKIRFHWQYEDVSRVAGVNVYYYDYYFYDDWMLADTVTAPETTALVTNLPENDNYDFELRTFDDQGEQSVWPQSYITTIAMYGVYLNEVLPYPKTGELEWIEIYNGSYEAIDPGDLSLGIYNGSSQTEQFLFVCPNYDCGSIDPGQFFVYYLSPNFLQLNNTSALINLYLYDELEELSFFIHPIQYFQAEKNVSFALDENVLGKFYHSTPGEENIFQNESPTSVITAQGAGTEACRVLNFNTTGASSSDPDGDELTYYWVYRTLSGQILHTDNVENPLSFRIDDTMGTDFEADLTVTDPFGASHTTTVAMQLGICRGKNAGINNNESPITDFEFSTDIIISEILPNPIGADSEKEYVELWNRGPTSVNLNGWSLLNNKNRPLDGYIIQSGQYLIISASQTTLAIKNTGDTLNLIDPNGDTVSTVTYPKAGEGQSYSLLQDLTYMWELPTPGEPTRSIAPNTGITAILMTRLLPNPEGPDTGREWIEIKNGTDQSISLRKWKLQNKSKSFEFTNHRLSPGSILKLADTQLGFSLVNSADTLKLTTANGEVKDELSWENAKSGKIYTREELISFNSEVAPEFATVTHVVDGDTVDITFNHQTERIRLLGVDTPETVHPFKPIEYFGKEASEFTRSTLEGKQIRLEYDENKRGKYGRLLAYIYVDNIFFNAELIKRGYAFAYLKFPFTYSQIFKELEDEARLNKVGIWASEEIEKIIVTRENEEDPELSLEEELESEEKEKKLVEERLIDIDQTGWDQVMLTEVFPNPEGADLLENEYVEIANLGTSIVELQDWIITDHKDRHLYNIAPSQEDGDSNPRLPWLLHPKEHILLPNLLRHIPNSKTTISLIDSLGQTRDTLSYQKSVPVDHVYTRNPVTRSWSLVTTGSPGIENPIIFAVNQDDADNDGISDAEEKLLGLNPDNWDSDGDGLSDDFELTVGSNPIKLESDVHQRRLLTEYQQYLKESLSVEIRQTQRTLRFFGFAKPYTRVKLVLHSNPQEFIIPVNSDGSWLYKIENYIEPGNHSAVAYSIDPNNFISLPQEPILFALVDALNKSKLSKRSSRSISSSTSNKATYTITGLDTWKQSTLTTVTCPSRYNCSVSLSSGQTLAISSDHYQPRLLHSLLKSGLPITYQLERGSSTPTIKNFKVSPPNPPFLYTRSSSGPLAILLIFFVVITTIFIARNQRFQQGILTFRSGISPLKTVEKKAKEEVKVC